MKIIFCNVPMKKLDTKLNYKSKDSNNLDICVYYPINKILASCLSPKDNVKVVLINKGENINFNIDLYKNELNEINSKINAKIEYKVVNSNFDEAEPRVHELLLSNLIDELQVNAQIYTDMTYGPKSLSIIMFSVLNFADKFFNSEIFDIVYGQVDFVKQNNVEKPINPIMCNMKSLYYINSINSLINIKDPLDAKSALNSLLNC